MTPLRKPHSFLRKHSLSLAALGVVILLIVLYRWSNPATHIGSFFGNAIADWTGVFVTIVMTKFLYEKGSAESKWGQVVGNIVSEWTQILGLVLMTKRLVETGSKEK